MSEPATQEVMRGPYQGQTIIGEVTEGVHKFMMNEWPGSTAKPRIEEDLSFVPKDREEVIYLYMYRLAHNPALLNPKRWRHAKFTITDDTTGKEEHYYERPPLYLDLFYMIAVHSKFRSDAERLLGWVILRLHEATHIVYRPRRYTLPDLREVDSTGSPWGLDNSGDGVVMEKVSLSLVDDLTIGDAINFFTIHEAPYRPYVTYRARCAMEGALVTGTPTIVRSQPVVPAEAERSSSEHPSGRMGRAPLQRTKRKTPIGPEGFDHGPLSGPNESEE